MAKPKSKLPKTLLGVRVPKKLRRPGAVASLLASPAAREVLADVLVAAAGAAAAALVRDRPGCANHSGELPGKLKDSPDRRERARNGSVGGGEQHPTG